MEANSLSSASEVSPSRAAKAKRKPRLQWSRSRGENRKTDRCGGVYDSGVIWRGLDFSLFLSVDFHNFAGRFRFFGILANFFVESVGEVALGERPSASVISNHGKSSTGVRQKPGHPAFRTTGRGQRFSLPSPRPRRHPCRLPHAVSGQSKPATKGRMKTSRFEGSIASWAAWAALGRNERTQRELAAFDFNFGGQRLVQPPDCA
jgi:hypothetical protein